jgi:DNA-directed RNA polymerase subunit alpha
VKDLFFEKPITEVVEISDGGNYGKFVIKPLERGFGITLGNALRRILMSSLPGAAITRINIEGAEHEFMSIDGIVEDVMAIILNLKKIVFKTGSDDPNYEATLEIHKNTAGPVLAGDIYCPSTYDLEVVNKDQYICTVAQGGSFDITLAVCRGVGYVGANRNKKEYETGVIAIDSIYTPVNNVSYEVNKLRGDNGSEMDELIIEVSTNGSIDAKEALAIASKMMINHLEVVVELSEKAKETDYMVETIVETKDSQLDMSIQDLDLSVRSFNCLMRAGIKTVGDLISRSEEDMMKVRNLGRKSLKEVKEKLEEMELSLRKD